MKKIFYNIASILLFTGMSYSQTDFEKLSWIVDRWVSTDGESISYEHWEKSSDNLLTGGSETVKNGDTLFAEKLKIEYYEGNIYYIADVKHNPAPVRFKLVSLSESEAVFENPEHDFPQRITYKQMEGSLHASIEGPGKDNKWKKIDFIMNKMR
jgi:hypothetical protein